MDDNTRKVAIKLFSRFRSNFLSSPFPEGFDWKFYHKCQQIANRTWNVFVRGKGPTRKNLSDPIQLPRVIEGGVWINNLQPPGPLPLPILPTSNGNGGGSMNLLDMIDLIHQGEPWVISSCCTLDVSGPGLHFPCRPLTWHLHQSPFFPGGIFIIITRDVLILTTSILIAL